MPQKYINEHFYSNRCTKRVLTNNFTSPAGIDLAQKLVEAELATTALGRERLNHLMALEIIEPCSIEVRVTKIPAIKSGYLFVNPKALSAYEEIIKAQS